jgi:hypothetical protein
VSLKPSFVASGGATINLPEFDVSVMVQQPNPLHMQGSRYTGAQGANSFGFVAPLVTLR